VGLFYTKKRQLIDPSSPPSSPERTCDEKREQKKEFCLQLATVPFFSSPLPILFVCLFRLAVIPINTYLNDEVQDKKYVTRPFQEKIKFEKINTVKGTYKLYQLI